MKEDTLHMTYFYYSLKHYLTALEKHWFEILTIKIFILIHLYNKITCVLESFIFIIPHFRIA
jgi:hypothetical protein